MSRHAVRATVAVAALSLSVLGPPVQAQDNPSAQELADLSALAEAQYSIGVKYDTGEGVPQDDAEAVIWYRRAAEQGHACAQYSLGRMYDIGRGAPEDDAEAVRWFRLAAEQGHAGAQYSLGLMYDDGLGVPRSVRWYRLAAEQGEASARSEMYGTGDPQDAEAVRWFRLAAEQGEASAQ